MSRKDEFSIDVGHDTPLYGPDSSREKAQKALERELEGARKIDEVLGGDEQDKPGRDE